MTYRSSCKVREALVRWDLVHARAVSDDRIGLMLLHAAFLRPTSQASLPSHHSSDCPQTVCAIPMHYRTPAFVAPLSLSQKLCVKQDRACVPQSPKVCCAFASNFPSILPSSPLAEKVRKLRRPIDSKSKWSAFGLPPCERTPPEYKAPSCLRPLLLRCTSHDPFLTLGFFPFSHDRFSCAIPPGTSHWPAALALAAIPHTVFHHALSSCSGFRSFFVGHPFVSPLRESPPGLTSIPLFSRHPN